MGVAHPIAKLRALATKIANLCHYSILPMSLNADYTSTIFSRQPPAEVGVCDVKVDADAIHLQTVLEPSVLCTLGGGALLWGSLASCGRLSIGQLSRLHRNSGGRQPPRRLPAGCQPAPHLQSDATPMSHTPEVG